MKTRTLGLLAGIGSLIVARAASGGFTGIEVIAEPVDLDGDGNNDAITALVYAEFTSPDDQLLGVCGTQDLPIQIDVTGGTLDFTPGEYILDGAGMSFSGGEINGADVSFYLTADSGQGDSISISADSLVDLTAPWDGQNPGVLFYQDRDSPANIAHSFTGGANMNVEGILYFPNQDLKFAGGTAIDPVTTLIVADTIEFTGNTEVDDFDGSAIAANPLLITVTLVE